jgi:hypothetical protein
MIINFVIIFLMLILFLISPIRFSNNNIIESTYNVSYNRIATYVIHILVILELINIYYKFPLFKFWVVIPYLFCYAIIDIIYSEPISKNGKLNVAPKYVFKSYIIHIIILALMIYNIVETGSNIKYIGYVNVVLIIILLILQYKYASCKYNLPSTWDKL